MLEAQSQRQVEVSAVVGGVRFNGLAEKRLSGGGLIGIQGLETIGHIIDLLREQQTEDQDADNHHTLSLMPEVPDSRKHHGDAQPVGGGNDIPVVDRSAGLDEGRSAVLYGLFEAVGKREEGVRGHHAASQR